MARLLTVFWALLGLLALAAAQEQETTDFFVGNSQLLTALNVALERIRASGRLAALATSHLGITQTLPTCSSATYPPAASAVGTLKKVIDSRVITFGGTLDIAPLGSLNASGVPVGFDIDLAAAIAAELSSAYPGEEATDVSADEVATDFPIQVEWKEVKKFGDFFGDLHFGLANPNPLIDVAMSSIFITSERAKKVGFTCPYLEQEMRAVRGTRSFTGNPLNAASDLKQSGLLVGAVRGTTNEAYVKKEVDTSNVRVYDSFAAQRAALKDEAVHVIVLDEHLAKSVPGTLLTFTVGEVFKAGIATRIDRVASVPAVTPAPTPAPPPPATANKTMCTVSSFDDQKRVSTCHTDCNTGGCSSCSISSQMPSCASAVVAKSEGASCCGGYHCCKESCSETCAPQKCKKVCKKKGGSCRKKCKPGKCRQSCFCASSVRNQRCNVVCSHTYTPRIVATHDSVVYTTEMYCATDASCPSRFYRGMVIGQAYECDVDPATNRMTFLAEIPEAPWAKSLSEAPGRVAPAGLLVVALSALLMVLLC